MYTRVVRYVVDVSAYVAAPVGCFVVAEHIAHAFVDSGLSALVMWGRPGVHDVRTLVGALDAELPGNSPPHVSLTDARRLTGVDTEAFEGFVRYLRSNNDALARNTAAHAILRPDGLPGVIVSGFFDVAVVPHNSRVFADPGEALSWLGRRAEDLAALDAIVDRIVGADPVLRSLRAHLERAYVDTTLASAARAVGVAPRTLQVHLKSARTSFRAELTAARVAAAQALLESTDTKLSAIALEVGCASLQHFSTMFRRATGMTPSAFRASHRPR